MWSNLTRFRRHVQRLEPESGPDNCLFSDGKVEFFQATVGTAVPRSGAVSVERLPPENPPRTFAAMNTIAPSAFEDGFPGPLPMGDIDSDVRKARVCGNLPSKVEP